MVEFGEELAPCFTVLLRRHTGLNIRHRCCIDGTVLLRLVFYLNRYEGFWPRWVPCNATRAHVVISATMNPILAVFDSRCDVRVAGLIRLDVFGMDQIRGLLSRVNRLGCVVSDGEA